MTHKLSLAVAQTPALTQLTSWFAYNSRPQTRIIRLSLDLSQGTTQLFREHGFAESELLMETVLPHPCVTCSIKDVVSVWLQENPGPELETLLFLPENTPLECVAPQLIAGELLPPEQFVVTETVFIVEHAYVASGIFDPNFEYLANQTQPVETPDWEINNTDEEADPATEKVDQLYETALNLRNNLAYADHLLLPMSSGAEDQLAKELVEILSRPATVVGTLSEFDFACLFAHEHQYEMALVGIDPLCVLAEEPSNESLNPVYITEVSAESGLWGIRLNTFHLVDPQQIITFLNTLCEFRICARGYFHLPTRPDTGVWQVAGGTYALGLAEETDLNGTVLEVVGFGALAKEQIKTLFKEIVLDTDQLLARKWEYQSDLFSDAIQ